MKKVLIFFYLFIIVFFYGSIDQVQADFGVTTPPNEGFNYGGTYGGTNYQYQRLKYTMTKNATVTGIQLYIRETQSTYGTFVNVWQYVDQTSNGTLIGTTETLTPAQITSGYVTFNFTTPINMNNGVTYWIDVRSTGLVTGSGNYANSTPNGIGSGYFQRYYSSSRQNYTTSHHMRFNAIEGASDTTPPTITNDLSTDTLYEVTQNTISFSGITVQDDTSYSGSYIKYGTSTGSMNDIQVLSGGSGAIYGTISNLTPSTKYYMKLYSQDDDNNTGSGDIFDWITNDWTATGYTLVIVQDPTNYIAMRAGDGFYENDGITLDENLHSWHFDENYFDYSTGSITESITYYNYGTYNPFKELYDCNDNQVEEWFDGGHAPSYNVNLYTQANNQYTDVNTYSQYLQLINYYDDGQDSVGGHCDNIYDYGPGQNETFGYLKNIWGEVESNTCRDIMVCESWYQENLITYFVDVNTTDVGGYQDPTIQGGDDINVYNYETQLKLIDEVVGGVYSEGILYLYNQEKYSDIDTHEINCNDDNNIVTGSGSGFDFCANEYLFYIKLDTIKDVHTYEPDNYYIDSKIFGLGHEGWVKIEGEQKNTHVDNDYYNVKIKGVRLDLLGSLQIPNRTTDYIDYGYWHNYDVYQSYNDDYNLQGFCYNSYPMLNDNLNMLSCFDGYITYQDHFKLYCSDRQMGTLAYLRGENLIDHFYCSGSGTVILQAEDEVYVNSTGSILDVVYDYLMNQEQTGTGAVDKVEKILNFDTDNDGSISPWEFMTGIWNLLIYIWDQLGVILRELLEFIEVMMGLGNTGQEQQDLFGYIFGVPTIYASDTMTGASDLIAYQVFDKIKGGESIGSKIFTFVYYGLISAVILIIFIFFYYKP